MLTNHSFCDGGVQCVCVLDVLPNVWMVKGKYSKICMVQLIGSILY